MVLLCLSDIHGDKTGLEQVLDSAPEAEAVIIAGDVTQRGRYEEARMVLEPLLLRKLPLFAVPGNMDAGDARRYLGELGIDIHGRGVAFKGIGIQGLGGSNPTPMGTPFELDDEEAGTLLEAGHAEIKSLQYRILVSHAPPHGTKTDVRSLGWHIGSKAVRAFIHEAQPDLCLCGHVHESAGEDMLGRTLCVNIGSYRSGRYAIVRIDGQKADVSWRKR
jgi:Icc-related predicted phosphoesterase